MLTDLQKQSFIILEIILMGENEDGFENERLSEGAGY